MAAGMNSKTQQYAVNNICCHCGRKKVINTMSPELKAFGETSMPDRPTSSITDEELLFAKTQNPNIYVDKIHNVNIYRNHLDNIIENYPQLRKGYWYVFTPRIMKISDDSNKPSRIADCGYWIAIDHVDEDYFYDVSVYYHRTMWFAYYEGNYPNGTKTDWIMEEYALEGEDQQIFHKDDMKIDYVLCKIYKEEKKKRTGSVHGIKKLLTEDVNKDWLTLGFA